MTTPQVDESADFRDHIATADKSGKRIWVYPTKPRGRLYRARSIVALVLLALFFAIPFIKLGGQPLVLFDILGRNFLFFGLVFRPQDFYLLVLTVLTAAVFIVLFTAIFGRLFCGWVCPQTIFMEMVFRRIEFWIEGGPAKQRRLREGPWTGSKIVKWGVKHTMFFALSFVIGNFLLAYMIGVDELWHIVTDPVSGHLAGLIVMLLFSMVFYGVFAWFREQACTLVCPYGRLQGVLIDSNTIIVAYDHKRGEPRGKRVKGEDRSDKGDCVACRSCVTVCPTGIDIRNGTQLECVNCTACIDICNNVMRKLGWPEGLIRYSSENRLRGVEGRRQTGRVMVYSIALAILASLLTFFLAARTIVETTVFRAPGTMFYETDDGSVRNLYSAKLVNKTFETYGVATAIERTTCGLDSYGPGSACASAGGYHRRGFLHRDPSS